MKYIMECSNMACRVYNEVPKDIMCKMYAIEDNLEFLIKTLIEQYPEDEGSVYPAYLYDQIAVDLCSADDEFCINKTDGDNSKGICLEVVTEETAILNDKDFLSDLSAEEHEKYKLGDKYYSYYTKLADTDYYFRFM